MSILNLSSINKIEKQVSSKFQPVVYPHGKNLFNKDAIVEGEMVVSDGSTSSISTWYTSDYIPVIEGAKIIINMLQRGATTYNGFYDINKSPIIDSLKTNNDSRVTRIRTVPKGAVYFRFSNQIAAIGYEPDKIQIEYGEVSTSYEPFSPFPKTPNFQNPQEVVVSSNVNIDSPTLEKSALWQSGGFKQYNFPCGKNMFNKNTVLLDRMITSLGNLEVATNWYVSDFIPVIANATIKLRSLKSSAVCNAFYDTNKNIITSSILSSDDTISKNNVLIVPDNAVYFRFTGRVDINNPWGLEGMQVEYGEEFTGYEDYAPFPTQPNFLKPQEVISTDSELSKTGINWNTGGFRQIQYPYGKNLFNKDAISEGRLVNQSGTLSYSSDWYASDYIPVIGSSTIKFNLIHPSKAVYAAFYDVNKKFIGAKTNNEIIADGYKLNTPSNAVYFRFSNRLDINGQGLPDVMQVEYGEYVTSYEPFNPFPSQPNFIKPQEVVITDNQNVRGYKTISDRREYKIVKHDTDSPIVAVHKNIAVRYGATILSISEDGVNGDYKHSIKFDNVNFPNLKTPTTVENVLIVPYTRNMDRTQSGEDYRIVVITTLGQIYHNFPDRETTRAGESLEGDIAKFDESVIWELKDRKFPSTDPNATGVEAYTPGLPESHYEYSPKISHDNGYGNGGFPKSITRYNREYARYYEPQKVAYRHSFTFMGGYEPTHKLTLLGTYKSNGSQELASRICVFATSDGGRSWYTKYEFASYSGTANPGVTIDTSATRFDDSGVGDFADYVSESFKINSITHNVPSAENKEPDGLFTLGDDIVVTGITKAKTSVVTTATPHGLTDHSIVRFKDNDLSSAVSPSWDWLRNDTLTNSSGGNGKLYKVMRISDTQFSLNMYIHNPFNNLACRHIHSINRAKDGFIIGCGETYPNGWILYMSVKDSDSFGVIDASYPNIPIVRLTSTNKSIARPLGCLMLDDKDNTIIFGSDEAKIDRGSITLPEGRTTTIGRSSTGVFKGRLEDVDDISKFECIFEAEQVAYFFKEKLGVWIFGGMQGEAGLSFDRGATWYKDDFSTTVQHFRGYAENMIVIDDVIIILKN